jgi:hypothetical protein
VLKEFFSKQNKNSKSYITTLSKHDIEEALKYIESGLTNSDIDFLISQLYSETHNVLALNVDSLYKLFDIKKISEVDLKNYLDPNYVFEEDEPLKQTTETIKIPVKD